MSVKPCSPGSGGGTLAGVVSPGTATYSCQPLVDYVRAAYYGVGTSLYNPGTEISGGQQWMRNDLYQITAKSKRIGAKGSDVAGMMQELLADRFKLRVHRVTREVPVYALTGAKGGVKLPAARVECWTPVPGENPTPPPPGQPPVPWCGMGQRNREGIVVRGSTMEEFCLALSRMPFQLDRRKFIDKTGITGRFDFILKFRAIGGAARSGESDGSAMDSARDEELSRPESSLRSAGLKLVGGKGTVEALVIDHAERPPAN